ncbi:MAG: hypothetical protein FWE12_04340 [Oscillospiraceae bacterium]|nr:hypothetical protein [Oscillospiraceae bacterium]
MTELIRIWVLGLTGAAFLAAIAMTLTPKGRPRAVVGLVAGLGTIIALIAPIVEFDYAAFSQNIAGFESSLETRTAEWEVEQERLSSLIIRERSEAYILDKAESLGLVGLDIEVATARGSDGWLYPHRIWISGPHTQSQQSALSEFLTGTFGIPVERQYWSETNE